MPSCGFWYCDTYDNNSKARGVGVLCQKQDGCQVGLKGCGGCAIVASWGCRFSGYTTYFAASMASFGFRYSDIYDNNSKARGVGVLCQK